MSKIIEYYVHGHTGKGFVNYIMSNLQQIERVFLLKNADSYVITVLLDQLVGLFNNAQVELIKSTKSNQFTDGIILRNESLAILNEQILMGEKIEEDNVSYFDLSAYPFYHGSTFNKSFNNEAAVYEEVYDNFKTGLAIHEKLEKIYIAAMDFSKANNIIENLLNELFKNVKKKKNHALIIERMFGTNTPDGIVNGIPNLIQPINNKIFITGRAGTGKSYVMNQVLQKCIDFGIDVEVYRCSLDPNSFDMLILRELDVCLLDNTPPHQIEVKDPTIRIIDMFKETVNKEVERERTKEINHLKKEYKDFMQKGLKIMERLKVNLIEHQNLNLDKIAEVTQKIKNHL